VDPAAFLRMHGPANAGHSIHTPDVLYSRDRVPEGLHSADVAPADTGTSIVALQLVREGTVRLPSSDLLCVPSVRREERADSLSRAVGTGADASGYRPEHGELGRCNAAPNCR